MAIAVASTATTAVGATGGSPDFNTNIAKPSGLAVGDLMIAFIAGRDLASFSTPSGWTAETLHTTGAAIQAMFTKIADSSDVAASSFDFPASDIGEGGGVILRVTGAISTAGSYITADGDGAGSEASPSVSLTASPFVTGSLVILLWNSDDPSDNGSFSSQAITGGVSPSITQAFEYVNTTEDRVHNLSYAVYDSDADITAVSADQTNGTLILNQDAQVLLFNPTVSESVTADVNSVATAIPTAALSTNTNLTPNPSTIAVSIIDPTTSVTNRTRWTPRGKPSTTWTRVN